MISELKIDLSKPSCVEWASQVKAFEGRDSVTFKPGLNVLWAPNGHGKTSILLAMARMLFCAQGGVQKITWQSLRDAGYSGDSTGGYEGLVPVHDGAPTMFCDPSISVGLVGGGAGFDWDFGMAGFANVMMRGSSGQTTTRRLDGALAALIKGEFPEITARVRSPAGGPVGTADDLLEAPADALLPWLESLEIGSFITPIPNSEGVAPRLGVSRLNEWQYSFWGADGHIAQDGPHGMSEVIARRFVQADQQVNV